MLKLLSCTLWYHHEQNTNKAPSNWPNFSTMPLEQEVGVMSLFLPGSSLLPEVRASADCSQLTFHWADAELFGSKTPKRRLLWREREEENVWSCAPDLSHASQGQPETAILSSRIPLTSV